MKKCTHFCDAKIMHPKKIQNFGRTKKVKNVVHVSSKKRKRFRNAKIVPKKNSKFWPEKKWKMFSFWCRNIACGKQCQIIVKKSTRFRDAKIMPQFRREKNSQFWWEKKWKTLSFQRRNISCGLWCLIVMKNGTPFHDAKWNIVPQFRRETFQKFGGKKKWKMLLSPVVPNLIEKVYAFTRCENHAPILAQKKREKALSFWHANIAWVLRCLIVIEKGKRIRDARIVPQI